MNTCINNSNKSVVAWLQVILFLSLILYWGKMLFIPLFFGLLIAIMTIIPYIGIFVSAMLPISVVWIETGTIYSLCGYTQNHQRSYRRMEVR